MKVYDEGKITETCGCKNGELVGHELVEDALTSLHC